MLAPIGVIGVCGSVVMTLVAAYVNFRFGWVIPHPDTPTLNGVAFTPANITFWQLQFWMGVVAIFSSLGWHRGDWKIAWITTGLTWILMGLVAVMGPAPTV